MTNLRTIEDVNRALDTEFAIRAAGLREMKPAEQKLSASRIADLHEIRRDLFKELLNRLHEVVVADAVRDMATATSRAIDADDNSVSFWRGLAGAR